MKANSQARFDNFVAAAFSLALWLRDSDCTGKDKATIRREYEREYEYMLDRLSEVYDDGEEE
jgi:hypothetical protein